MTDQREFRSSCFELMKMCGEGEVCRKAFASFVDTKEVVWFFEKRTCLSFVIFAFLLSAKETKRFDIPHLHRRLTTRNNGRCGTPAGRSFFISILYKNDKSSRAISLFRVAHLRANSECREMIALSSGTANLHKKLRLQN